MLEVDLLAQAKAAFDRFYDIVDRWWPDRNKPEVRSVAHDAAAELELLLAEAERGSVPRAAQAQVLRWLGDVYSELSGEQKFAVGEDLVILSQAASAFARAEALLQRSEGSRERGILAFNYANLLRRFDTGNVHLLEAAHRRYDLALRLFKQHAPSLASQVDGPLATVLLAIRLAPVSRLIDDKRKLLEDIGALMANGAPLGKTSELIIKFLEGGGPAVLARRVAAVLKDLPKSVRDDDTDGRLHEIITRLLLIASTAPSLEAEADASIVTALEERMNADVNAGIVDSTRAATLRDALNRIASVVGSEDQRALRKALSQLRGGAREFLPALRDMSYGLPLPDAGIRAATVRDYWWSVRSRMLEEGLACTHGERERALADDLITRSTEIDKRLIISSTKSHHTLQIEAEAARPLALEIRRFAGRWRPFLASPIWSTSPPPHEPNSVVFCGRPDLRDRIGKVCVNRRLDLLQEPAGPDISDAHWLGIARAHVTIFDMASPPGPALASVCYALGIAQSLGKPSVVISDRGGLLPFDIDLAPVRDGDWSGLEDALDRALFWIPSASDGSLAATVVELRKRYALSSDLYIKQSLRALDADSVDPIQTLDAIESLQRFIGRSAPAVLTPIWKGCYPEDSVRRLFHVTAFQPNWAAEAMRVLDEVCQAKHCTYVRGDRDLDPQVIHSIWADICRSSHILVDLTGFTPNVAFELGIAHTLGRPTLIVGNEDVVARLFPAIAKMRIHSYNTSNLKTELTRIVERWLEAA